MTFEKKVSIIAWIPLQIVAYYIVDKIYYYSMHIFSGRNCYSFIPVHITPYFTFTIPILLFVIIGGVLIFSNEYGGRKFWKKFGILYMVHFLIIAVFLFLILSNDYGWCPLHLEPGLYAAIASFLFPVFSLLGLILVITVAKWLKK